MTLGFSFGIFELNNVEVLLQRYIDFHLVISLIVHIPCWWIKHVQCYECSIPMFNVMNVPYPGAAPPKPLSLQCVGTFKLPACCPHRGTGMSEHRTGRSGVQVSESCLSWGWPLYQLGSRLLGPADTKVGHKLP
jgi:hypothetical protein